jgi:hypothetical protein
LFTDADVSEHIWFVTCKRNRAALLLFVKSLGALGQFLRRDVFLVRGDEPSVAGRILHAAVPVAVEHVGRLHHFRAADLDRALVHGVHVGNVKIKRGRGCLRHFAFFGNHDAGIADQDLRMQDRSVRPLERLVRYLGAERLLEEFDDFSRAAHGEIRRHGVIAVRNGFCCHDFLPAFLQNT